MLRRHRLLIIVFALVGLGASALALYVHHQSLTSPSYSSFCDISATVSCQQVLESTYGRVLGVPVAAGGAIWSGLVLLLAAWGMRAASSESAARAAGYIFVLATVGLAAVFYFGYVSFFVLRQACPLCIAMYVAVIGVFVSSATAAGPLGSLAGRVGGDLAGLRRSPTASTLALIWVAASVALLVLFPRDQPVSAAGTGATPAAAAAPMETLTADQIAEWEKWLDAQPRVSEAAPAGAVKVRIIKFNDYQCPACRQTWAEYRGLVAKYEAAHPEAFEFETRDYPLEMECGFGGAHGSACEAAVAVRLARTKGREHEMEAWIFERQETLSRDLVKQGLQEVAQVGDFDARYAAVLGEVRADAQLGQKLGITSTPTFYINGIKVPSLRPAYFDAAIAYELRRAGVTS